MRDARQRAGARERALGGRGGFSFFAQQSARTVHFLGGSLKGTDLSKVAYNHSPRFFVEDSAMKLGVRTLLNLTVDYMEQKHKGSE